MGIPLYRLLHFWRRYVFWWNFAIPYSLKCCQARSHQLSHVTKCVSRTSFILENRLCCRRWYHAHIQKLGCYLATVNIKNPDSQWVYFLHTVITWFINACREWTFFHWSYKILFELKCGAIAALTIHIVFVRLEEYLAAISLSEKISRNNGVSSSPGDRGILFRCPCGFGPPWIWSPADLVSPRTKSASGFGPAWGTESASGFGLLPRIWSPLFSRYVRL